ncbi:type II toxin-antitoxin system Phd/YefM family antitoxin [Candidatus Poriferisodalis sp.]|uniref:type II toxin-antitoxin system Phd/YefM family antitoxin n=1 Tax=Candidatus Poriferisodalis sp. TaxID=3101277 RepID=UPI003B59E7CD
MASDPAPPVSEEHHPGTVSPLRTIAAADFKARCLKILDDVRDSGDHITITKHGHPVAKLVPVQPVGRRTSIIGACKGSIAYDPDETFEGSTIAEMDAWQANLDDSHAMVTEG